MNVGGVRIKLIIKDPQKCSETEAALLAIEEERRYS